MNPGAILLFILAAIVFRAIEARKKQGGRLPPVAHPSHPAWPTPPKARPTPASASDRPYVQDVDPQAPPTWDRAAHEPKPVIRPATPTTTPVYVPPARIDTRPHEITERELTTAGELDAPAGSALARLQASIEERRLALERRHAKGISVRSADRG